MRNSNALIYNLIAIVFTGLTIFAFLCTLLMFARVITPPYFLQPGSLATPTIVVPATDTITPTPSITPIPSNTPVPPTATPVPPTETPTPSPSPVPPTATPLPPSPTAPPTSTLPPVPTLPPAVNTAVPPTATATKKVAPSRTPVGFVPSRTPVGVFPTQTPLPTLKPQSNQPFVLEDGYPTKGPNPDFQTGCNYMGIAGVVLDLSGQPIRTRYKVNITGPDKKVLSTQPNPQNDALYSPGSFVAQLAAKPTAGKYTIQLFTRQNKPISDPVSITFAAGASACNENIAYVSFTQVKPASLP